MAKLGPQVLQVYVLDGVVSPSNPKIPNQGMIVLVNQDLHFYRVQLWNDNADVYPAMYGVLPPLGRLVIMGGPAANDQNTECPFELYETDMTKPDPYKAKGKVVTGPGHVITIGSGGAKSKRKKRRR
jgi:hypothetical protein